MLRRSKKGVEALGRFWHKGTEFHEGHIFTGE